MIHGPKVLSVLLISCLVCRATQALVVGGGHISRTTDVEATTRGRSSTARSVSSSSLSSRTEGMGRGTISPLSLLDLTRNDRYEDYRERRRKFVSLVATGVTEFLAPQILPSSDWATTIQRSDPISSALNPAPKMTNLSNEELAEVIKSDSRDRQFLFTADMTRSIYDESATFKDGSDLDGSYPIDAWVRGCKVLFDAKESQCKILEHTLSVTSHQVKFRFAEVLQFRTVFRPRVYLTGTVIMKRHPQTGLIVHYEEKWDQDLQELMRRLKWGTSF